jgi:hypothetical protein
MTKENHINVTIDQINASRNILLGTLKVLDESLVPGHLSVELHNARIHCTKMIQNIDGQIESMKALAKETHKTKTAEDKKRKANKQRDRKKVKIVK